MNPFPHPIDKETPTEMKELMGAIAQLPDCTQLAGPVARLIDSLNRKKRILTLVQEALTQLRLDIKYLLFDLESTRRERDEYKAQLGK